MDDAVGIDLRAIRNRFETEIRLMVVVAVALICGCQYSHVNHDENADVHPITDIFDFRKEMRLAYIEMCKQEAQCEHGDNQGWAEDCLREYRGEYKIVYVDARYLSFYVEAYVCAGFNAHGGTSITVGTIDRKTSQVLKAADLIPERRMAEVRAALVDGIAKKLGGKKNLLSEPKIIDNCYLAADGIHFVYNEYEVAPYAEGPVDAVVQVPTDISKPVPVTQVTTRPIY